MGFNRFAAAVLALGLGVTVPAIAVATSDADVSSSEINSSGSQQVMVCVDWETKNLKFSKYWDSCPSRHQDILLGTTGPQGEEGPTGPQGPQGATGTTTSLWDSLPNCYTKLQTALEAGLFMSLKTDREFFEGATGCVVEDIKNESKIQIYEQMGLPVITDWEFVALSGGGEGDGFGSVDIYTGHESTFLFTVANGDFLSALNPNYRLCFINQIGNTGSLGLPQGNGVYRTEGVYVRATPWSLTAEVTLGYRNSQWHWNQCNAFNFNEWVDSLEANWTHTQRNVNDLVIHMDPATMIGLGTFDDQLNYWGW